MSLSDVLAQYGQGQMDDQTAVEKVKNLLAAADGPESKDDSLSAGDQYVKSLEDDDNFWPGTWQDVAAAHAMGKISSDQYRTLAEGVTGKDAPKEQPKT